MDVSPDALGCEQLAGRVDDDLCEFTGEAVCTDGVRASVWYTLGKPARGHATYHRPEDGCRGVLDLGERVEQPAMAAPRRRKRNPLIPTDLSLGVVADKLRLRAEEEGDRIDASRARILDGLEVFGYARNGRRPSPADWERLERKIATVLFAEGVSPRHGRTVRLLRSSKVGSARAALASELAERVEVEFKYAGARPVIDRVAGSIAMGVYHDWPATPGLRALSFDELRALVLKGIERLQTNDAESLVRAGLRAIGSKLLGISKRQIAELYGFEKKRTQRRVSPSP